MKTMNDQERNELTERASFAFNAEFRAKLADAVTVAMLSEPSSIGLAPPCFCPLGRLPHSPMRRPPPDAMAILYPEFTWQQFGAFIHCFDLGAGLDNGSPEDALGLLYRARFL